MPTPPTEKKGSLLLLFFFFLLYSHTLLHLTHPYITASVEYKATARNPHGEEEEVKEEDRRHPSRSTLLCSTLAKYNLLLYA